ncbi:hypothetical protein FB561_2538 [Kribbella amoyensis]|uniref:Uncharacterized protein n=1 Tax=Kribbella amoyensis TaxID=996641 RepID=A0A561BRM4_9ACTN|nr:hypothetical protein FB561_2538 [Kribbella amoyensis]
MSGRVPGGTLVGMTGDFLPRRRQASIRAQLLTLVVVLAAAAAVVVYLVR